MYRPGTQHPFLTASEQFSQFCELYSSIADIIDNSHVLAYIFGDINLDCLKYSNCSRVSEYVDLLFSHGFLQVITKPTRCTANSATLIDHVVTNSSSSEFKSVILISQLTDHFPVFHFISNMKKAKCPKSYTTRELTDINISNFNDSLSSMRWADVLVTADPQIAYNNFSETFSSLYDIHIPVVTKKFNRNFHKIEPWMTAGLLTSRRRKISLEKSNFQYPSAISLQAFLSLSKSV